MEGATGGRWRIRDAENYLRIKILQLIWKKQFAYLNQNMTD